MEVNIFKKIRKSYVSVLIVAFLGNTLVFGQPIIQLVHVKKNRIVQPQHFKRDSKKVGFTGKPTTKKVSSYFKEHISNLGKKNKEATSLGVNPRTFSAQNQEAIIGKLTSAQAENINDNFFDITIPQDIDLGKFDVFLTYDLFGLYSASQTTKSINGNRAYGGIIIEKTTSWKPVKEAVPAYQIKNGPNEIYFNRREDEHYQYKIKNLKVVLQPKKITPLVLSEEKLYNYGGKLYISGFVNNPHIEHVELITDKRTKVSVIGGRFEYYFTDLPKTIQAIQISYSNQSLKVPVQYSKNKDFVLNTKAFKENKRLITPTTVGEMEEVITLGAMGVEKINLLPNPEAKVSLHQLPFKDIKVMNLGFYNVTAGASPAYRLTRKNIPDSVPTKIHLSYDTSKIPNGYTVKDIKTYYYHTAKRQWVALPVDSIGYEQGYIVSTAIGNQTDYVNGIIKIPESPEAANFAPTTLQDMEYANPAAGIVSISTPQPNNTGSLSTSFPLKLPQGRNGIQPHLSLSYNSEYGNSWLGIGWNFLTPAVTLNTTWGAPRFNKTTETEMYTLNGSDLVFKDDDVDNNIEYSSSHRQNNIKRKANRTFYERVERGYNKIIRHGDDPENYWWEVTNKRGVKRYYGGYNGSIEENTIKRTNTGEIVHWALYRVEDPHGNYMQYNYFKNPQKNLTNTSETALEFYPLSIEYTLHNTNVNEGYYRVDFLRNSYTVSDSGDTSFTAREDKILRGKNACLELIEDVLTEVKIYMVDETNTDHLIRTYRLDYEKKAFKKTQLTRIAEYDTEGILFYNNNLEYFEVDDENLYGGEETYGGNDDGLVDGVQVIGMPGIPSQMVLGGSALGTSVNSGNTLGMRVGIGLGLNVFSKSKSVGFNYSHSTSNQEALSALVDVNGDGLPDKVFKDGYSIRFRENTGSGFSSTKYNLTNLSTINKTKSITNSLGGDANFKVATIGKSWSTTRSHTDGYFLDRNGDGLVDMVSGGNIKFNTTRSSTNKNLREFTSNVLNSENVISSGVVSNEIIEDIEFPSKLELQDENPQYDVVKVWEAPFSGTISISGTAQLNKIEDNKEPNEFEVTIEQQVTPTTPTHILVNKQLNESTNAVKMNKSSIDVHKGDRLFFRSHNKKIGSGGIVNWSPTIQYASTTPGGLNFSDENGNNTFMFKAKDDFLLTNGSGFEVGNAEDAAINFNTIALNWNSYEFTDDVRFVVKRIRYHEEDGRQVPVSPSYWSRTYNHKTGVISGNNGSDLIPNFSLDVPSGYRDVFYFYVESDSNIKWGNIDWQPVLITTNRGQSQPYYPPVDHKIYNNNASSFIHYIRKDRLPDPNIQVDPNDPSKNDRESYLMKINHNLNPHVMDYSLLDDIPEEEFPVQINFVLKDNTNGLIQVFAKRAIIIDRLPAGAYSVHFNSDPILVTKNEIKNMDGLFVGLYTTCPGVLELNKNIMGTLPPTIELKLTPAEQALQSWQPISVEKPFFVMQEGLFGNPYRGWGQFLYNGGLKIERDNEGDPVYDSNNNLIIADRFGEYANGTIKEIDMGVFPDQNDADEISAIDENTDYSEIESKGLGTVPRYSFYFQDNAYVDNTPKNPKYVHKAIQTTYGVSTNNELEEVLSRFGEANILDVYIAPNDLGQGDGFIGLKQYSKSKGKTTTGGVSDPIGGSGATGSSSNAETEIQNRLVDLNGDSYPDIVTKHKIQYTAATGGLSNKILSGQNYSVKSKSSDFYLGASLGGLLASTKSDNNNEIAPPPYGANLSSDAGVGNPTGSQGSTGIGGGSFQSWSNVVWLDVNGDGLADRIHTEAKNQTDIKVDLNLGYGFSEPFVWGTYPKGSTAKGENAGASASFNPDAYGSIALGAGFKLAQSDRNCLFVDVNRDGLVDLVYKEMGQTYKYRLNTGTSFSSTAKPFYYGDLGKNFSLSGNMFASLTGGIAFSLFGFNFKVIGSPSFTANSGLNQTKNLVQDIDGDGYPDILTKGDNDTEIKARKSKIKKAHLLKKVYTPLGGTWEVDYTRTGNTYDLPQSKWVVRTIRTNDHFTGDNAFSNDETLTSINYENPNYHRRERSFIGFQKLTVEKRNPQDSSLLRYVEHDYHNTTVYLKGAKKQTSAYDANGQLSSKKWVLYNILDPEAPQVNLNANEAGKYLQNSLIALGALELDQSRLFVAPVQSESYSYEGGSSVHTTELFTYDNKGNVVNYSRSGSGIGTYTTEINYYQDTNFSSLENAVGFPQKISVKDIAGTLLRERLAAYTSNGNLQKVTTKLNQSQNNEVEFVYDTYGNLSTVRDLDSQDQAGNPFEQSITYDSLLHTYPTGFSNSFGHQSSSTYNYVLGREVLTTDINGQSIRKRYDNRGRLIEVTSPKDILSQWTIRMEYEGEPLLESKIDPYDYSTYIYNAEGSFYAQDKNSLSNDNQHYAVTRHKDPQVGTNQFLTISIIDGNGYAIQQKKSIYSNLMKWMVSGKQEKDVLGRVFNEYLPTFDRDNFPANASISSTMPPNALLYDDNVSSFPPLQKSYDHKDRVVSITQPDESNAAQISYGIEGGLLANELVNELGQTQKTFTNLNGNTLKTLQNNTITTAFTYNPLGELLSVKDTDGYVTENKYDLAGRRIEVRHPDQGVSLFKYDQAGNLIERQTSKMITGKKDKKITYAYTFNRLDQVSYPNSENNIYYTYGAPDDSYAQQHHSIGRVATIEDATGFKAFEYGEMGEVILTLQAIAVAGVHSYWFFTEWEYDRWNRLMSVTYPDLEKVSYTYDRGGNLYSITSGYIYYGHPTQTDIVKSITYNDYGERSQIVYGNNTVTNYQYDNRRRLANVQHQFTNLTQEKEIGYDALSNIIEISTVDPFNSLPSQHDNLGGPVTYTYTYDDYNRLIHAEGTYAGYNNFSEGLLQQEYELDMGYDDSHNILEKSQLHRQGDADVIFGPLANPTNVRETSYDLVYDDYANGAFVTNNYGYVQPHAPRKITETPKGLGGHQGPVDPRVREYEIVYDANGNQTEILEEVGKEKVSLRKNIWDDENRLRAVDLNPEEEDNHPASAYTYDNTGERILKYNLERFDAYSNGTNVAENVNREIRIYPNALLSGTVIPLAEEASGGEPTEDNRPATMRYTKHYYIGGERVASKIGTAIDLGLFYESMFNFGILRQECNQKVNKATSALIDTYAGFHIHDQVGAPIVEGELEGEINSQDYTHNNDRLDVYWYHPDHLGSSNYITNLAGNITQHMEYLPFGETLVEEHLNSYNSPYKFNGKELDDETGNYYYGARYYNPKFSLWLSVDPMAEKYPGWSPYNYTLNNPVKYVDPTGMSVEENPVYDSQGNYRGDTEEGFTGEAIIYDGNEDFSSMSKDELVDNNGGKYYGEARSELSTDAQDKVLTNMLECYTLPDGTEMNSDLNFDVQIKEDDSQANARYGKKIDGKHILKDHGTYAEYTVENVRATFGNHEMYGHGILGLKGRFNGRETRDHLNLYLLSYKNAPQNVTNKWKENASYNIIKTYPEFNNGKSAPRKYYTDFLKSGGEAFWNKR